MHKLFTNLVYFETQLISFFGHPPENSYERLISQHTIEQITNRIDIIEVIGGFVNLKKRGANYLGLCPFHNEKSPSFTVSPSKEIYKCFGCGKSGNTINFLMDHEKYSYVEAIKWLANKYNVEIEESDVTPERKLQQQVADSLHIVNSFAQKFFTEQLFNSDEGRDIGMSYLKERGFNEEIIKKFQLGFSPSKRDAFSSAAINAKYNLELLQKTGLIVLRDDKPVDNYRGRIIFPVHNQTGKIIGFGARIIGKNDRAPKYINTPENEIYVKSKILYGSYFARQSIDKNDECLLVEGYTDVISLHQAGIENVVASGGTSLTQDQLRLIKKYTNNLTIIYDGDLAGIKAALRGLDMALEESLNVKLVLIPDKEDPDSYLQKVGATAFSEFIASNKKDFILFQLEIMLKDAGNDISKKSDVINKIATTLSKMTHPKSFSKRQEYIRRCASILRISEEGLTDLVRENIKERLAKEGTPYAIDEKTFFNESAAKEQEEPLNTAIHLLLESTYQEREVIKRLIEYGQKWWDESKKNCDVIFETLDDYHLNNEILNRIVEIYKDFLDQYGEAMDAKKLFLYSIEDADLNKFVVSLLHFPHELHNWDRRLGYTIKKIDEDIREVIEYALAFYKLRKIKLMYAEVENDIENNKDVDRNILAHLALKKLETEITDKLGTVIMK